VTDDVLDAATVESLLESVGGDREFLGELFATFIDEAPGLLDTLQRGMSEQDAETARRAAHTLKSTGASLGASHLAELAKQMEEATLSGNLAYDALATDIARAVDETVVAMRKVIDEGSAS
jgi:HPt (histidine-containing phosphotransfer) domain-containing protein